MLNENIKNIRKNKGFTQEELATAEYSNGICTVEFADKLLNSTDYNMTLSISNEANERNVTIFTSLSLHDNGYTWTTPWNQ